MFPLKRHFAWCWILAPFVVMWFKHPRSYGIAVRAPTNYHRSNIVVAPAFHSPLIRRNRDDIGHSKNRQDHSGIWAVLLIHWVDPLDMDIVIYLRKSNEIYMQSALFFSPPLSFSMIRYIRFVFFFCFSFIFVRSFIRLTDTHYTSLAKIRYWFIHFGAE